MARAVLLFEVLNADQRTSVNYNTALMRRNMRAQANAMKLTDWEFRAHYRLSKRLFRNLCSEIKPYMTQAKRRSKVSVENKVLAALSFFATGSYQKPVGMSYLHGLSQPSVSKAVKEVTRALNHPRILNKYVCFPQTSQERQHIVNRFFDKFGFPGCLGCIDGTHVAMIRPSEHEERFFNRKHYHSRNVQKICDSDLNIINVDASFGGATHDAHIWKMSEIQRHVQNLHSREAIWLLEGVSPAVVVENDGDNGSHLNISDVFEVISHDYPTIGAGAALEDMSRPPGPPGAPHVVIVEQPAGKALRFRYECEGRSAGSIPGVKSTPENRTYPTIMISGYKGRVVVVVSCVTKDEPYKPHPHNLVGRECQRGVCTVRETITEENCQVAFKNLGIQCVKRRDIAEALRVREELRVDPFKTRYHHKNQPQSIDLNAVRLCFQVFMTDDAGKVRHSLAPVVSDVIYDKKAMSDLHIAMMSQCSGPMKGGTTVILLCEKVNKEDTAVVFYQEENGQEVWKERAHVELVHKQVAIVFKTPAYYPATPHHVKVQILLQRLTDGAKSIPVNFEYIPDRFCTPDAGYIEGIKRKRPPSILQEYDHDRGFGDSKIKSEPRDKLSPRPLNQFNDQWQYEGMAGPSVQYPPQWAWQSPPYAMQTMSPQHDINMHMAGSLQVPALSPNLQQLEQSMSPSPSLAGHSPRGHVSPALAMSPLQQQMSPSPVSPALHQMSPALHPMSPGMMQPMPVTQQFAPIPQSMMETGVDSTPSFTSLLQDNAGPATVDSTDLSIISSMFADRAPDLSDSLNRLSTSDLLQP